MHRFLLRWATGGHCCDRILALGMHQLRGRSGYTQSGEDRGPGVGGGSLGWLVDFRAQIPWSEPPRMAVKMGGWVCKISNFQDV